MYESEFSIVAISDISGGYYNANGIDIPAALTYFIENSSLEGFADAEKITNEELLALDVDVLVPSAIGGVITKDNVDNIKAKYIIEGANAPTHAGADEILHERGVYILPDILANAGGVTVSYFEWVQNRQYYHWDLSRTRQELDLSLIHI